MHQIKLRPDLLDADTLATIAHLNTRDPFTGQAREACAPEGGDPFAKYGSGCGAEDFLFTNRNKAE